VREGVLTLIDPETDGLVDWDGRGSRLIGTHGSIKWAMYECVRLINTHNIAITHRTSS